MIRRSYKFLLLVTISQMVAAPSVFACAACYGKSDSPLAKGMNWGIFSLLLVIVSVLGSIAAVSFVLARRAAAVSQVAASPKNPGFHSESSIEHPISSAQPADSRTV
jgi:hypothetical protein